ncbi:hypothetical protein C8Q74DRAFT_1372960 [Fomes fomentarius]|nr:hypothetical protein C8Q74DRAFT_1372960 [Fomes fomentarius]
MNAIQAQIKQNFRNSLTQAGDLSRRNAAQDVQGSSVPDSAHKLNGLMIAAEGMLRDSRDLFQDMIIQLAEEHKRKNPSPEDNDEPSSPNIPTAISIPEPRATVLSEPLSTIVNAVIGISDRATPCRYRFIDCSTLVHQQTLRVVEYDALSDLHPHAYAAVSYIWRGAIGPPPFSMAQFGTFSVVGVTDGDPISIDVLLHVARACLRDEIPLVWLDRLCIIQTSKEDKSWQIQRMYGIYASCGHCYILPGGTRRLVSLEEPTLWIHRGWTLQEAVAPKNCSVVVRWPHASGTFDNPHQRLGSTGSIDVVVPGESCKLPLSPLLKASVADTVEFRVRSPETMTGRKVDVTIGIFGSGEVGRRHAFALSGAMIAEDDTRDREGVQKKTALWRSAVMRTSSRPVDMVFSIMGLFGVMLNPKDFHDDDRLGATIALGRKILEQGGSPNWLCMSLALPQNPVLRSFPAFPDTDVAGTAVYTVGARKVEVADLMIDIDGWLGVEGIPGAHMDDHGFLTFTALSASVECTGLCQPQHSTTTSSARGYDDQLLQFHTAHVPPFVVDNSGLVWKVVDQESATVRGAAVSPCYIVVLGRMYTVSHTRFFDPEMLVRAVLLVEYKEGRFCRPERGSWFTFNRMDFLFDGWKERDFTV